MFPPPRGTPPPHLAPRPYRPERADRGERGASSAKSEAMTVLPGVLVLVALIAVPGLARSVYTEVLHGRATASALGAVTSITVLAVSAALLLVSPFLLRRLRTALTSDRTAWAADVADALDSPAVRDVLIPAVTEHAEWPKAVLAVIEEHRIESRAIIEALFEDTMEQRGADRERLTQLERRAESMDRLLATAAEALRSLPDLKTAVERMSTAVTQLERVVERVARENDAQGKDMAHMRGLMDAHYDGPERRHSGRRQGDHG